MLFVPPIAIKAEDVAREILSAARDLRGKITILATFMAHHGISEILTDGEVKVPSFPFPEVAARALSRAAEYGAWLRTTPSRVPKFADVKKEEAAGLVAKALAKGRGWLDPEEAEALLSAYGVPRHSDDHLGPGGDHLLNEEPFGPVPLP